MSSIYYVLENLMYVCGHGTYGFMIQINVSES